MLSQAHCYAEHAGVDAWEFAIEIDEFRRARIGSSELRWLLSQGYAIHANETAPENGRRRFCQSLSISLNKTSCFTIAKAGIALLELSDAAIPPTALESRESRTLLPLRIVKSNGDDKRHTSHAEKPWWDAQRRELRVRGQVVKHFRRPAPNQQLILDLFQSAQWPTHLADPLPMRAAYCPKRRLHDAIKRLNRHHRQPAIRFSGDGSGCGVLWALVD